LVSRSFVDVAKPEVPVQHRHDTIALIEGKVGPEVGVENGKGTGCDGRSERDAEPADDGQAGCLGQHAKAQLEIERQTADPTEATLVAHLFSVLLPTAEHERSASACLLAAHARAQILLGFHIDMEAKLLVHPRLGLLAAKYQSDP